jgi:hypothetical protein
MFVLDARMTCRRQSSLLLTVFTGVLACQMFLVITYAIAAEQIPQKAISLTLDQAINLAFLANRSIATSRFGTENQRFSVEAAKSEFDIKILPLAGAGVQGTNTDSYGNLALGATVQKKFDWGATGSIGPNVLWSGGDYGTGINVALKQPLLKGLGKDVNDDRILSALYSLDASGRTLTQTEIMGSTPL